MKRNPFLKSEVLSVGGKHFHLTYLKKEDGWVRSFVNGKYCFDAPTKQRVAHQTKLHIKLKLR